MSTIWFIVPAHGRLNLSAICLRQLRRTCDSLSENGVEATAVVIADDENLDTARDLGFGTVERDNQFVSRRFNDGIQLACDPAFNPRPVDYVVPCGSDDWVDWRLFMDLPHPNTMLGFQHVSFVQEDGRVMTTHQVTYEGGCGVRVLSRQIVRACGYRPADEDRRRGCDTSMLTNLKRELDFRVRHVDIDPRQIVDWKSPGENLNPYAAVSRFRARSRHDPFTELADIFPAEALDEMQAHYSRELVPA